VVYAGTYPESVTLSQAVTVTCQGTTTLAGLTIAAGTFIAPDGTLTLTGDLVHTGGTFDANSGTVAFTGTSPRTLTATAPTQFNDLAVGTGITLVLSTNNDNVGVEGTLTNDGAIEKSFGITGVSLDFFGSQGSLTQLTVDRVDQNHPKATGPLQNGMYWSFTPNAGATGFNVNMTLPANFVPDDQDKVCRYTGVDEIWDCAANYFDAALQTITRAGVTAFSDWAVGDDAGPMAVQVRQLTTQLPLTGLGALVGLALGLLVAGKLWRDIKRRAAK